MAPFETITDDHTMLNASIGYRFITGPTVHDIVLRGTNLNDTLTCNPVSFLKDLVPSLQMHGNGGFPKSAVGD